METKQLYKKILDDEHNEIGQEDFSPVTLIESIFDSDTGHRLDQILGLINHWYVPYAGDAIEAYSVIKSNMRHTGLIITYRDENDSPITRQYKGASYNDTEWSKISNWVSYPS